MSFKRIKRVFHSPIETLLCNVYVVFSIIAYAMILRFTINWPKDKIAINGFTHFLARVNSLQKQ